MIKSVIVFLSLAVIASAVEWPQDLQGFMSTLKEQNSEFEQRIEDTIQSERELTTNDGRKERDDLESWAKNVHKKLETMMGKIKSAIDNVKEHSVKEDLERVLSFLQMFDERNQKVQKKARSLSVYIARGTFTNSSDIRSGFEDLKKLHFIDFDIINMIVARLNVELP